MTIDTSGEWPTATEAADLDGFLRDAGEYPADRFVHARCACGGATFHLDLGEDAARRRCATCGAATLMLDSAEQWDEDAAPDEGACPCGSEVFELAVGFSHRDGRSLRWVTIGARCVACGIVGVYADWKIDYEPYDHLYGAV